MTKEAIIEIFKEEMWFDDGIWVIDDDKFEVVANKILALQPTDEEIENYANTAWLSLSVMRGANFVKEFKRK